MRGPKISYPANIEVHRPWMTPGNLVPNGPEWRPDPRELAVVITDADGSRAYAWHRSAHEAHKMAVKAMGRFP